jgi:hypothetical protein
MHSVSDVRQIEIHTAEQSVPGYSCLQVEINVAQMKKYKSPDSGQIPAELIQARDETYISTCTIHKLINSIWNKERLPNQWWPETLMDASKQADLEPSMKRIKHMLLY